MNKLYTDDMDDRPGALIEFARTALDSGKFGEAAEAIQDAGARHVIIPRRNDADYLGRLLDGAERLAGSAETKFLKIADEVVTRIICFVPFGSEIDEKAGAAKERLSQLMQQRGNKPAEATS